MGKQMTFSNDFQSTKTILNYEIIGLILIYFQCVPTCIEIKIALSYKMMAWSSNYQKPPQKPYKRILISRYYDGISRN